MNRTLSVILLMCSLLCVAETPAVQRADYLFMEALRQRAAGHRDLEMMLLNRAQRLDPEDLTLGQMAGYYRMVLADGDSAMFADGYALADRYFRANPSDLYAGLNFANVNQHIGRPDIALEVWATLDSLHPQNPSVIWNYSALLLDNRRPQEAVAALRRMQRITGPSIDVSTRIMQAAMMNQQPDSALAEARRLTEVMPRSAEAHALLAEMYAERGDSVAYEAEIINAFSLDDIDSAALAELLRNYVRVHIDDPDSEPRIRELFEMAIDRDPHSEEIHHLYAAYLATMHQWEEAAEQFEYVANLSAADADAWMTAVRLFNTAGAYDRALATGREALRFFPDDAELTMLLVYTYLHEKDYEHARELILNAIELHTDAETRSSLTSQLGDLNHAIGDDAEAFRNYEDALALNPDNDEALNNYAYFLVTVPDGNPERAEQMAKRALMLRPGYPTYIDTMAWILFRKGEYKDAKEMIDTVLAAMDGQPSGEVLHHAGDIYFFCGDVNRAVELWEQALEEEPDNELLKRKVKHRTYFYE